MSAYGPTSPAAQRYGGGYQAPPRQPMRDSFGPRMNPANGYRPFQPPQQQQKQGGGFWRGLGNALKAPFTGGGTTNNYYGGMNQRSSPNQSGRMTPYSGGYNQQYGQMMKPWMQGGMNGPQQGGQQQPWKIENTIVPGTYEYQNRGSINPWQGNAPGWGQGPPQQNQSQIPEQPQGGIGPTPEQQQQFEQQLQQRGIPTQGWGTPIMNQGGGVQGGSPNSAVWGPNGEWRGR